METPRLTDSGKIQLLQRILNEALETSDGWTPTTASPDGVGVGLAYLVHAVVNDEQCSAHPDYEEMQPTVDLLRRIAEPDDLIWGFISFECSSEIK